MHRFRKLLNAISYVHICLQVGPVYIHFCIDLSVNNRLTTKDISSHVSVDSAKHGHELIFAVINFF